MINSKNTLSKLTIKEKCSLLSGNAMMGTYPIERLAVPSLVFSDGPNGIRRDNNTSTCFPSGVSLASSWDKELLFEIGDALGKECVNYGINVLLGPAFNIKRNPLCGRNFEYYSEDPFLVGHLATNFVKGVQSNGVGSCIKHYACNNNEKFRVYGDSIVDERALREIYLKPFEIVVKNASPLALMSSYNKINGVHASENKYLLKDILRDEWHFEGVTMTDWGGLVNRDIALNNGTDLEMPGCNSYNIETLTKSCSLGKVKEEDIDKSVERMLKLINETTKEKVIPDISNHHDLAIKAATKSGVLLKNKNKILPLNKEEKILVVGSLFESMRYQACGSAFINSDNVSSHIDAFNNRNIKYKYIKGYDSTTFTDNKKLLKELDETLSGYDKVLFYGGLTDYVEMEAYDRSNFDLEQNQVKVIDILLKAKKKVIFVIFGGSPFAMPFYDDLCGVLYMGLPGEGIGEATTRLLFGEENPSGRLAETWPIKYDDVPFGNEFDSSPNSIYKESIYVGYRYYCSINKETRFPFGYGLSYADLKYSNFSVKCDKEIIINLNIENLSNISSEEVVQIYIGKESSKLHRPSKELKCFTKVLVPAKGDTKVSINVPLTDLMAYSEKDKKEILEDGKYIVYLCKNAAETIYFQSITIKGHKDINPSKVDEYYKDLNSILSMTDHDYESIHNREIKPYVVPKKPYTFETPLHAYKSLTGKIIYKAMVNEGKKKYKSAKKIKDNILKENVKKNALFLIRLMETNNLRCLCNSSGGQLKYNMASGILALANRRIIKGIKLFALKNK